MRSLLQATNRFIELVHTRKKVLINIKSILIKMALKEGIIDVHLPRFYPREVTKEGTN